MLSFPVRVLAFWRKEIAAVLRQPRLLTTLVLGPFLILLLFGLGYSAKPIPLRTLFVVPEDSELQPYVEEYGTSVVTQLIYEGMIDDEEVARARLRAGQVDLVIVVPADVSETIRNNQQATFTIYHDEIDPIRASYANAFANIYVGEMNRRTLQLFTSQSQQEASTIQPDVTAAKNSASALRQAMEANDEATARQRLDDLEREIGDLEATLLIGGVLLGQQEMPNGQSTGQDGADPASILPQLRQDIDALRAAGSSPQDKTDASQRLSRIEEGLGRLETTLDDFRSVDASVLVSPFRADVQTVMPVNITLVDFYVPGVIALLLQHPCVTFGALSIVRERRIGTMELFQVSPLSAFEVLLGKYLSYSFFTALITAVLVGLLYLILQVPMLGNWGDFALTIVALLFAALGLGFVISLLARTTSQAVQYSMLALLVSVFFTGFLLSLDLLTPAVRAISQIVPGTYGIELLQNIMLRGQALNLFSFGTLLGMGLALFLLAWWLLQRVMARS